jgi:CBS domain containing-hemolysin-like protein
MNLELSILLSVIVLIGNAFFVGAEFALVSARRSSIELKALGGSRLAKITLSGMENVSLLLAGAQLGVTLCSLIFGAVAEPLVEHALEGPFHYIGLPEAFIVPVSFFIALIAMVYIHVVIGEMVPKNLSLAKSVHAALLLVPPLFYIVKIFNPLIVSLNWIANSFIKLLGIKPRSEIKSSFTHDEVAGFIKESHREGLLSKEEEQLLSGTLSLEERTIQHIVLPLSKVKLTSTEPTVNEIESLCVKTGFSRFPVPDGSGGLKGYIHLKDVLKLLDSSKDDEPLTNLIRPLGKVKKGTSLRDALALMQHERHHIAEVVSENNIVVGIIMLEDVLEELVGPIQDETRKTSL